MKPHSGLWLGAFITRDGRSVKVQVNLDVHDDTSIEGRFEVTPADPDDWKGPLRGRFDEGGYSPFGSIHLEEEEEKEQYGEATFDGRFEVTEDNMGVMYGTVLIRKGEQTELGTLLLAYVRARVVEAHGMWGG
jgi:hypothetical protein